MKKPIEIGQMMEIGIDEMRKAFIPYFSGKSCEIRASDRKLHKINLMIEVPKYTCTFSRTIAKTKKMLMRPKNWFKRKMITKSPVVMPRLKASMIIFGAIVRIFLVINTAPLFHLRLCFKKLIISNGGSL